MISQRAMFCIRNEFWKISSVMLFRSDYFGHTYSFSSTVVAFFALSEFQIAALSSILYFTVRIVQYD